MDLTGKQGDLSFCLGFCMRNAFMALRMILENEKKLVSQAAAVVLGKKYL